ncbi:hypothetical protein EYR38_006989 [Pleurotus pulmonarius]|nr:hypothetical protein EYR38_006989 [Pleurotus pulmonarius]
MATPMSRGKTLGPLVIANCVNSLSYTLELVMAYVYFRNYQEDRKLMKLAVAALLLIGLVSVVSYMACTYLYTVVHWGNQEYLEVQNTFIIISLLTTGISATIVQSFMTFRYWTFSLNSFIALILAILAMFSFGDSLISSVIIKSNPHYSDRNKVAVVMTSWLSFSACLDIATTVCLVWTLKHTSASFIRTKSFGSGGVTSVGAVLALVSYLVDGESNVWLGIISCLRPLYVLTMVSDFVLPSLLSSSFQQLFNLIMRKVIRNRLAPGHSFLNTSDLYFSHENISQSAHATDLNHADAPISGNQFTAVYQFGELCIKLPPTGVTTFPSPP